MEIKSNIQERTMFSIIFSIFYWLFITLTSIVMFIFALLIWLFTLPFDRNLRILHQFSSFWASLYTWFNPAWQVSIEGKEHIKKGETYVMVCNHQSAVDIPVLFRLFTHFKWVSKDILFKIPLIGWNMCLNRYIRIKRGSIKSQMKMLDDCKKNLQAGSSVMIFPEGTRSKTGEMKSFKRGAFDLALKTGKPILPIVINGTSDVLPKNSFIIKGRHHVKIRILPPFHSSSFSEKQPELILNEVRGEMVKNLEELKG